MTDAQGTSIETSPASPIVVGVDGSEVSIAALRYAAGLAKALDKGLQAVAVWELPRSMYDAYYPEPGWSPENDAQKILDETGVAVFGNEKPDWFSTSTLKGRPAAALIEASGSAEMLILGSRGHGGFAGMVLGSVSAACAAHARCPVLIVR